MGPDVDHEREYEHEQGRGGTGVSVASPYLLPDLLLLFLGILEILLRRGHRLGLRSRLLFGESGGFLDLLQSLHQVSHLVIHFVDFSLFLLHHWVGSRRRRRRWRQNSGRGAARIPSRRRALGQAVCVAHTVLVPTNRSTVIALAIEAGELVNPEVARVEGERDEDRRVVLGRNGRNDYERPVGLKQRHDLAAYSLHVRHATLGHNRVNGPLVHRKLEAAATAPTLKVLLQAGTVAHEVLEPTAVAGALAF
mmetsp:Transcript_73456/g.208958  ORF Transcript_73456/g.208958 Transcript_73456/m.208958 type:complete len:251 (+) Transcript_73456:2457-3209(+)